MRRLISVAVLAVILVASCGGDDDVGVGTTATSPSPTAGSDAGSDTSPPVTGTVTLRGDGLGAVTFGQDADEVIPILEVLVGSPPSDSGSRAGWVEFVGWGDLGLFVGFDTPAAEGYTGASRFVGWEYFGSDGGTGFATAEGASIGTVLVELQALYGDRLEVFNDPDECVGDTAYPIVLDGAIFGVLDRAPADDARVNILRAGMGVGC